MRIVIICTLAILFPCCLCPAQNNAESVWTVEKERLHNKNRNDSTTWSQKNWNTDTKHIKVHGRPMINGVFPVPKYELIGTFPGSSTAGNWDGYDVNGKKVVYLILSIANNSLIKEYIGDKSDEAYFAIAVLTDTIDTERYSHAHAGISSRNYPHYVGQGYVKTKSNRVDYYAMLTADRNNYAMVNMRLFDLRIGRIVLIAPKKDGTFRSLQLEGPLMSAEEMDQHMQGLLERDKSVRDFFLQAGNI